MINTKKIKSRVGNIAIRETNNHSHTILRLKCRHLNTLLDIEDSAMLLYPIQVLSTN